MKGNIEVSLAETRAIANELESYFNEKNPDTKLVVNSNPSNYALLEKAISGKAVSTVGKRFLCKLIYESKKTRDRTLIFRLERINAVYRYVFKMSRGEFLKSNSILPHKVIYFRVMQGLDKKKEEIESFILQGRNMGIRLEADDFTNIQALDSNQLLSLINSNSVRIVICINRSILYDVDGMYLLREVLLSYVSRLALDPNIILLISDQLFVDPLNIHRHNGRILLFDFWNQERSKINSNCSIELYSSEYLKKIEAIEKDSIKILHGISEIHKLNWNNSNLVHSQVNDTIHPITQRISQSKISDIYKVIEDLSRDDMKPRDLLCVISYEKYFHLSEREEMADFFREFYDKLESKHNIIRIFCLKGKVTARGDFRSLHPSDENETAVEYLSLGKKSKVLFMIYNESPFQIGESSILYEQDYVLSMPAQGIDFENDSMKNLNEKLNNISDPDLSECRIILAYPEDEKGANRIIQLDNLNFVALKKWVLDFSTRVNRNVQTKNHLTKDFKKERIDILEMLKLTKSHSKKK